MSSNLSIQRRIPAPDGGWGWLVFAGVMYESVLFQGLPSSFGLIFGQFLDELDVGTRGLTIISSAVYFTSSLTGIFSNFLISRWGPRKCAVAASVLLVVGATGTIFVQTYWQLLLCYSIIPGIGVGVLFVTSYYIFNEYWEKRRSFALSLLLLISGLLAIMIPMFVELLLRNYGFRGTLLILAGFYFNLFVCTLLFRPLTAPEQPSHLVKTQEGLIKTEINKNSLVEQIRDIFDLNLLRDPVTVNVIIGLTLIAFGDSIVVTILPIYLMHLGISRTDAALCITASAFADVLGRLTLTLIGYFGKFKNRKVHLAGAFFITIFRIGLMLVDGFYPLLLFSSLLGFARAFITVPVTLVLADQVEHSRFPAALGLYNFILGFAVLCLSPVIGLIRDWSGSYSLAMHTVSAITLCVVISWLIESRIFKRNFQNTLPNS